MKIWPADKDFTYNIPEQSDRYSWNGICLEIKQPQWYDDVTPLRETQILRSINGRAVVSTDLAIERVDLSLHLTFITEKEKKAIQDFMTFLGSYGQDGFPFPYMRYAEGFEDHDESQFVMIFLAQEITFTEVQTVTQTLNQEVTDRRYNVDLPVRLLRQERLLRLNNEMYAKIYWLNEEAWSIKLSYETFPSEGIYGWLESLDGFSSSSQIDGFGSVSNVTLNLVAYAQYNTLPLDHPFRLPHKHIEGITDAHIEIYYRLNGKDHVVFKGRTYTPIRWTDAKRVISFDCVMNVKSDNIGYQPDFENNRLLSEFMLKDNWPHIFGQGLFDFTPICKQPNTQIAIDLYITENYTDPLKNIFKSGQAWQLPVNPDIPMPVGEHIYLIPVEGGNIRVKGSIAVGLLTITQMNVPYLTNIPVVSIPQYDTGYQYKRDREDYQPNTLLILDTFSTPYLAEKHIRVKAQRSQFIINDRGQFVEEIIEGIYWATVADQNDHVLFLEDPRNTQGQEITLSGWISTEILEVMDNRLFEPYSWSLLQADEIKNQRSMKHRRKYLDDEQNHLAVHIRKSSSLVCTDWLFDKVYPLSLEEYTRINHAFLKIDNRLYWVPVYAVYSYTEEGGLVPVQYDTADWTAPLWDLQEIIPFLPDGCVFAVLLDHYESIVGDVVNNLTDDHKIFDFILTKYTDLESATHTSTPLPTNFISREYEDARSWLARVCKERGKRIIVQRDATAYTSDLIPAVKGKFNENTIEANSISFDSLTMEDIITKYRFTTLWNDAVMVMASENWKERKKKFPENDQAITIFSYWEESFWRYWLEWSSKIWRKVTFKAFMQDLPFLNPLERVQIQTEIFSGIGLIESIGLEDKSVSITVITEEEVI